MEQAREGRWHPAPIAESPPMPAKPTDVSARARTLHQQSLVLDGLTPYYTLDEPYTASLLEGGISGALLSVVSDATWAATLQRTETALEKIDKSPHLMLALHAAAFR